MKSIVTITGISDSFRLTTLSAVKTAAVIDAATDDSFLNLAIDRQSAVAAAWCRRTFARQNYSEVFRDVDCAEELALRHYPIAALTSITVDGTALAGAEYERDNDTGFLYRLSSDARIEWSGAKITVVYSGGYILPSQTTIGGTPHGGARDLPHDVESAVIELVKMDYFARDRDPQVRSQDIPGVFGEAFSMGAAHSGAIPDRVAGMLGPYRRMLIG
jgi:hypothetical protein